MSGFGKKAASEQSFVASLGARPELRLFLICGPDQSAVADIARKMVMSLGEGCEIMELDSDQIQRDPALLADEASAISLFGDRRAIRLSINREQGLAALENLLDAPTAGNPVIATAGDLKGTSKIRKLALSHKLAALQLCYLPELRDLVPMIQEMAKDAGLRLDRQLAQQIADGCGNDRRLAAMEIEKLALYYDASLDAPAVVDHQLWSELSAANDQDDMGPLINSVLGGNLKKLGQDLRECRGTGMNPVGFLRALQRRIAQLDEISAKLAGRRADSHAVKSAGVFWKEADDFARQLGNWPPHRLAGLNAHILAVEKKLMETKAELGQTIFEEEMLRLARLARRAR